MAMLASRLDPETLLVLKGNKPLGRRFHARHRAVLYASNPAYPYAVNGDVCLEVEPHGGVEEHGADRLALVDTL